MGFVGLVKSELPKNVIRMRLLSISEKKPKLSPVLVEDLQKMLSEAETAIKILSFSLQQLRSLGQ